MLPNRVRLLGGGVGVAAVMAWWALSVPIGNCCFWGWLPVCGSLCGSAMQFVVR